MAGSSQAANLSGMLSQIGGTIGGMGKAGDALVRPLENTFRPDVDPNDPEALRRLMQWQQGMGREDAARTTMMQAERLAEKQQQQKKMEGGQVLANINQAMTQAMTDPSLSDEVRSKRMAALSQAAVEAAGRFQLDPMQASNMASEVKREVEGGQLRQMRLQSAQKAEQAKKEQQQLVAVVAKGNIQPGTSQWKALANSPIGQKNSDFMRSLENEEMQRAESAARNAERVMEKKTAPDLTFAKSKLESELLPPEMKEEYGAQLKAVEDAIKSKMKSGGFANVSEKRQLVKQLSQIEGELSRAVFTQQAGIEADRRATNTHNRQIDRAIASYEPDKWEVEDVSAALMEAAGEGAFTFTPDEGDALSEGQAKNVAAKVGGVAEDYVGKTISEIAADQLRKDAVKRLEAGRIGEASGNTAAPVIQFDENGNRIR